MQRRALFFSSTKSRYIKLQYFHTSFHVIVLSHLCSSSPDERQFISQTLSKGSFPIQLLLDHFIRFTLCSEQRGNQSGACEKKAAYHNHSKGNYPAVIFLHNHFRGFNHFVKDQTSSFLACWFHAHYLRSGLRLSDWFGNCRRLLLHPSVLLGHQGT